MGLKVDLLVHCIHWSLWLELLVTWRSSHCLGLTHHRRWSRKVNLLLWWVLTTSDKPWLRLLVLLLLIKQLVGSWKRLIFLCFLHCHLFLKHSCIFPLFIGLQTFGIFFLLSVLVKRIVSKSLTLKLLNFLRSISADCRLHSGWESWAIWLIHGLINCWHRWNLAVLWHIMRSHLMYIASKMIAHLLWLLLH